MTVYYLDTNPARFNPSQMRRLTINYPCGPSRACVLTGK